MDHPLSNINSGTSPVPVSEPSNNNFNRSASLDISDTSHSNAVNSVPSSSFRRSMSEHPSTSRVQARCNFHEVLREMAPFVQAARTVNQSVHNAISMTSFLNRPTPLRIMNDSSEQNNRNTGAVVIDMPDQPPAPPPPPLPPPVPTGSRNPASPSTEIISINSNTSDPEQNEFTVVINALLTYVPFAIILGIKASFDYSNNLASLLAVFATFLHSNITLRRETIKRQRRDVYALIILLIYIIACCICVHYLFFCNHFPGVWYLSLYREIEQPITFGKLMWTVLICDFTLKLITVIVKICITILPMQMLPYQRRGSVYCFVELLSQLYRNVVPIQPWLMYLLESYEGMGKILSVFLSAFYMVSKGNDLLNHFKKVRAASSKLLQIVTIGESPNKEQIEMAGDYCPICHDRYDTPVVLECKHIFCEACVSTWFDREQTCPLCRAKITDDPSWRDGATTYFIQIF